MFWSSHECRGLTIVYTVVLTVSVFQQPGYSMTVTCCLLWAASAWISSLMAIGVVGEMGRGPVGSQISLKSAIESETGVG